MRHIHFVSFATVATLIGTAACGSDSAGGGSGGTSAGGTSSGGTSSGGSAGSSAGGSAGVGTGGVATGGAAGSGTGGVATGGAAGGIATGGGGGTGGGATGACTNAPDQAIITAPNSDIEGKVGNCGQTHLGVEPATKDCIKQATGLSDPCVTCFDSTIQCAITNCWLQCIGGSDSAGCIACRAQFCDGPFEQCSGLTVD